MTWSALFNNGRQVTMNVLASGIIVGIGTMSHKFQMLHAGEKGNVQI